MASIFFKRAVPNHNKFHPVLSHSPFTFSGVSICHLAHAVEEVDEWSYRRVWPIYDMAKRASPRREVLHTDFITPYVLERSVWYIEFWVGLKTIAQGGYPEAERCRLSFGHPEVLTTVPDTVEALKCFMGTLVFNRVLMVTFLALFLAPGLREKKWGIFFCWYYLSCILGSAIYLWGEKGAHVYGVPKVVDFLTMSLNKVGNVPVTCKKMPLISLEYESPRIKIFRTEVASIRVDSVASAGFKISRAKLVGLISDGDVRVNSVTVTKNNTTIRSGDMITVSGKGRLKVDQIKEANRTWR